MMAKRSEDHLPHPKTGVLEYAAQLAERYIGSSSVDHRKARGQYFTCLLVARFMASLYRAPVRRVLDAGAGTGILTCAVIERHMKETADQGLHIDCYEPDECVADLLDLCLNHARHLFPLLSFTVRRADFALSALTSRDSLFGESLDRYDLAIGNPPYFKLPAASEVVQMATSQGISGTTNIYSLIMNLAAGLLKLHGELIYIVPRSFCSGLYFKSFRRQMLAELLLSRCTSSKVATACFETKRSCRRTSSCGFKKAERLERSF
ncbi:MAG: Eco57I restriction-modification methylase domain-containing protein [Candidatus Sumerlaeota bacterium]|nr:Eco57I restriction-modification methylase domain-containing protein [Candidatus Sumerlaeota bacterium]